MQNYISNKALKTDHILSVFLVAVITLMSFAMYFVMTAGLKRDLGEHFIESNTQEAKNISSQLTRYIADRKAQIIAQTNSSIIKQAVMRPESNRGALGDYLNNETIIGKHYYQALFDFRGKLILSNFPQQNARMEIPYETQNLDTKAELLKALYQNKHEFILEIDPQHRFWELALPVRYGNSVEGTLLTLIPITEMTELLKLNEAVDIQLRAETLNGNEYIWGPNADKDWQTLPSSVLPLTLSYSINTAALEMAFDSARNQLLLSIVTVSLLGIFLAIQFGRKYFVRPIETLQGFANTLSKGEATNLELDIHSTRELDELSFRIVSMAKKIKSREQSILEAHEKLKRNQETLIYAEKMASLGQVSAGVAHEINNPNGFIMANLTTLKEYHAYIKTLMAQLLELHNSLSNSSAHSEDHTNDDIPKLLEDINHTLASDDIDFLLNDLDCLIDESIVGAERVRDITKAMKGYAYSGDQTTQLSLNACIEATIKMAWNELKYSCEVEQTLEASLPLVECIGGQIEQVLLNIVINATHAMEGKSGVLKIHSYSDDTHVYVSIEDNGSGIEEEHLKQIFVPFFTTKDVGSGTGLGMSICYDIAKHHGGDINVESEVGVGTKFTLSLPIPR